MSKYMVLVGLLALGLGGCACGPRHGCCMKAQKHEKEGTEVKMSVDQMPAAVQTTIQKEAQGGAIAKGEKETEDGKTTYEADATINGKPYEIKVAEDGTLIEKKLEVKKEKGSKKEELGEHQDKD